MVLHQNFLLTANSAQESEFLKLLKRNGAPFDYERQLFNDHYERVLAVLDGKSPVAYELEIQPTSKCNLRCKHCFGSALTCTRLEDRMGERELEIIAKKVEDFNIDSLGIETIKFCGTTGEPLLNPITANGISLFKAQNKRVILYTNGLALDNFTESGERYVDCVTKADKINISLDAGTRQTFYDTKSVDGFDRTIKNIGDLVAARNSSRSNLRIDVSYVIGPNNFGEIGEAARAVRDLGADHMVFRVDFARPDQIRTISDKIIAQKANAIATSTKNFKVSFAYSDEEIRRGEEDGDTIDALRSKGKKCFNHNFWACIGPDCNLYVCGHRTYSGVDSFGSVLEHSLEELWLSKQRKDAVEKLPDDKCKFCSPSCHRRDCLMNLLLDMGPKQVEQLHTKYVTNQH